MLWVIQKQRWFCTSGTPELWPSLIHWAACHSVLHAHGDTLAWPSYWSSCNRLLLLRVHPLTPGWTGGAANRSPVDIGKAPPPALTQVREVTLVTLGYLTLRAAVSCVISCSVSPDLRRTRTEPQQSTQNHSQSQSWAHQGQPQLQGQHRGPPDNQGDLPPAKRLKLNPESQQQPVTPPRSQLPNLSPLNTHPPRPSSNSPNPHFPSPPLQGRLGGSGGGSRYSLRQALGRRSLARRILGKERLANHLRQRGVSTRGEEPELLTYQENSEDLQVGGA